jgi:hypothetical protein
MIAWVFEQIQEIEMNLGIDVASVHMFGVIVFNVQIYKICMHFLYALNK